MKDCSSMKQRSSARDEEHAFRFTETLLLFRQGFVASCSVALFDVTVDTLRVVDLPGPVRALRRSFLLRVCEVRFSSPKSRL